jgi:hypothetical protein
MSQKRTRQIEQRIDRIKKALLEIGAMRPGSLTRQYKDPQHHTGAYWQISYTRQMKSRTEYVRQESRRFAARLPDLGNPIGRNSVLSSTEAICRNRP